MKQSLTEHMQNLTVQLAIILRPDAKCKDKMENIYVLCCLAFHF